MWEISYQLHLWNVLAQNGTCLEVLENIQQVVRLGEDGDGMENTEVGLPVGPMEVVESVENMEGVEKKGNDDETMREE
jgi:hypothetical protein